MTSPTPAAPLPTRQQLDEIDALLRRMLTLPSMTTESPPPAPSVFSAPPAPTVREFLPSEPPAPGEPKVQSWRVEWPQNPAPQPASSPSIAAWGSPVTATPPAETVPWASHPTPPYAASAIESPRLQPTATPPIAPAMPPTPIPPASVPQSKSMVMWLLILLNMTFNMLTYLLGPLGTWLRGSGRTVLGWGGIAMIVAAILWAAGEWYGYDWPRPDLSRFGLRR